MSETHNLVCLTVFMCLLPSGQSDSQFWRFGGVGRSFRSPLTRNLGLQRFASYGLPQPEPEPEPEPSIVSDSRRRRLVSGSQPLKSIQQSIKSVTITTSRSTTRNYYFYFYYK